MGKHGTNRFSEDGRDSANVLKQRGASLSYQAGRLNRDRPDLYEELKHYQAFLSVSIIDIAILAASSVYFRHLTRRLFVLK